MTGNILLKMRFATRGKITKCNFTPECGSIRASNPELDYVGPVRLSISKSKVIFV